MWIARGHQRPHANVVPSSFVVPNVPFLMCQDTSASQLPVVGSASKLHGHPHAQLQLWIYSASKFHFVGIDRTPLARGGASVGVCLTIRGTLVVRPGPCIHIVTTVTHGRMGGGAPVEPAVLLRRVTFP